MSACVYVILFRAVFWAGNETSARDFCEPFSAGQVKGALYNTIAQTIDKRLLRYIQLEFKVNLECKLMDFLNF